MFVFVFGCVFCWCSGFDLLDVNSVDILVSLVLLLCGWRLVVVLVLMVSFGLVFCLGLLTALC